MNGKIEILWTDGTDGKTKRLILDNMEAWNNYDKKQLHAVGSISVRWIR